MAGYTAGVAKKLYDSFAGGTYLQVDTYEPMERLEASQKFAKEYNENYTDNLDEFLIEEDDYLSGEQYELFVNEDGSYTVNQTPMCFVDSLVEGGFRYELKDHYTDEGELDLDYYDSMDATVEDIEWIMLGVAGERAGDISVWVDPINETVGGRDFPEKSIAEYDVDIYDQLQYLVNDYILETINNTN